MVCVVVMTSIPPRPGVTIHGALAQFHANSSKLDGVDPLTDLLDAPRARSAFLLRVTMDPPWSVRVQDRAPLTVVALTAGTASFLPDGGAPVTLAAGDVLLVRGPEPYVVADRAGRAPQAVIHPGQRCETPDGESLELPMRQGIRTWGNARRRHRRDADRDLRERGRGRRADCSRHCRRTS